MYIVLSGAVEVLARRGDEELVRDMIGQGDFFGEMAIIDERPRSATVRAIGPTRVLPMTRESFLEQAKSIMGD